MKITITQSMEDGKRRYVATNRKGETITAKVHDSGHGFSIFWQQVLAKWPRAYCY